jgi:ferredoxin
MIRQLIKIEEEKCNGCGLCAKACHEGAIAMVYGKAKLIRDDYCDGLGDCLPVCPTGAISFEEREALEFNKDAVVENMEKENSENEERTCSSCPSTKVETFINNPEHQIPLVNNVEIKSQLTHWPVQIKLLPINAPYFENANLLIAADCAAFAYGDFHNKFIKNHIVMVGCPKLDEGDYSEKFTAILKNNNIKSVKVVKMEVPCCGGIERAIITALQNCGKMIPWQVITISMDGKILD